MNVCHYRCLMAGDFSECMGSLICCCGFVEVEKVAMMDHGNSGQS